MNTSVTKLRLRDKNEELSILREDIRIIQELVDNVQYTSEELLAFKEVAGAKVDKANKLYAEIFVLSQVLEVYIVCEAVEASSTVH